MSASVIHVVELSEGLNRLSGQWTRIRREALEDAILNGPLLQEIWMRTPKSSMQRYASELGGINLSVKGDLPRGWRKRLSAEDLHKVDRYGQERLAHSLMPGGTMPSQTYRGLDITDHADGPSFFIRSDLDYAEKMHEAQFPREGQYWTPNSDRGGWTTKGTGNRFLERPAENCADELAEIVADHLEEALRRML